MTTASHRPPRSAPTLIARRALALRALVAFAFALNLTGCGTRPALDVQLAEPTSVLLRGDTLTLEVTVMRSGGAKGEVTLELASLPEHISATLAPVVLVGDATTSTLRVHAESDAAEGAVDLALIATSDDLTASDRVLLQVASLTVRGRVESVAGGPYADVVVASQGRITATDADGAFALGGLSVPYDLRLSGDSAGWVHAFEGLRAAAPVLRPFGGSSTSVPFAASAEIVGDLTGGLLPVPVNHVVRVCAEGMGAIVYGCSTVPAGASTYSLTVPWVEDRGVRVKVHALEIELDPASGLPVAYPGYGAAVTELVDGDVATLDVAMTSLPEPAALDGSVEVDGTVDALYGAVRLGENLAMVIARDASGAASFTIPMPAIAGSSYEAFVAAAGTEVELALAWDSVPSGESARLRVLAPARLVSPADLVANVDGSTPFSVVNASMGVLTYVWTPTAAGPTIALTTQRTTVTLPDTAAAGAPIPGGAIYEWQAMVTSQADVDAAASHGVADFYRLFLAVVAGGPGFDGNGSYVITSPRSFSMAP